MTCSSSWASSRMSRHGCAGEWREVTVKVRLPGSLVGCGPDLNGSRRLGGAGQADIIGGGVLSLKHSKT